MLFFLEKLFRISIEVLDPFFLTAVISIFYTSQLKCLIGYIHMVSTTIVHDDRKCLTVNCPVCLYHYFEFNNVKQLQK